MKFTPEQVKAAMEALAGGDGAAALEILESLLTDAASGGAPADDKGAPPAAAGATGGNAEEPPPEMAALARGVLALFSGLEPGAALVEIEKLKAEAEKRAADSKVLESSERRALVGELVKLGREEPGTAWVDPDKTGAELVPVERLAKEDLAGLRKRVSIMRSTQGARPKTAHTPPAGGAGDTAPRKLSRAELAYCEKHKITPEQFQARTRDAVRTNQAARQ